MSYHQTSTNVEMKYFRLDIQIFTHAPKGEARIQVMWLIYLWSSKVVLTLNYPTSQTHKAVSTITLWGKVLWLNYWMQVGSMLASETDNVY